MPSFVITEKCDGCKGGDKTACMYICPNDLMVLEPNEMKAYNQEPDQCWECFSCVKICPTQAIEVRAELEALAGRLAAVRRTEQCLTDLEELAAAMGTTVPGVESLIQRGMSGLRSGLAKPDRSP